MTQPVTSANIPTALKQGVKGKLVKPIPPKPKK
jgi:hypothetical protein